MHLAQGKNRMLIIGMNQDVLLILIIAILFGITSNALQKSSIVHFFTSLSIVAAFFAVL